MGTENIGDDGSKVHGEASPAESGNTNAVRPPDFLTPVRPDVSKDRNSFVRESQMGDTSRRGVRFDLADKGSARGASRLGDVLGGTSGIVARPALNGGSMLVANRRKQGDASELLRSKIQTESQSHIHRSTMLQTRSAPIS